MKNLITLTSIVLFSSILVTANAATLSDTAKEKRWAEQIVPSLLVGEDIQLKANGATFLGLYAEPDDGKPKGAVILLHGIGVHPAWPEVIQPLRTRLVDMGWVTLSLQMPILANGAREREYAPLFAEVPERIQAGVDFLKARGIHNIVLAGHSMGTLMASYYLSLGTRKDAAVKGFIILSGENSLRYDPRADSLANLKAMRGVNILDVYGSNDTEGVKELIKIRQKVGKRIHGDHYHQLRIEGANHFYVDKEDELAKRVNAWMEGNITK
jgi:dienelactone hydrolase